MVNVLTFDNFDDMRAHHQAAREKANAALHAVQIGITYGTYAVAFEDVSRRLVVFGYIQPIEETLETERIAGASEEELADMRESTQGAHEAGSMWAKWYSTYDEWCRTNGEWGYRHRLNLWPIDESLYVMAQAAKWDIDALPEAGMVLLQDAYSHFHAHMTDLRRRGIFA